MHPSFVADFVADPRSFLGLCDECSMPATHFYGGAQLCDHCENEFEERWQEQMEMSDELNATT